MIDLEGTLLEAFLPGCVEPDFGRSFLVDYQKQSTHVGGPQLAPYALHADIKLNGSNYGQHFKQKYFDSTFNFCLTYSDELAATLGFEIDETTLNVWQIQGVKGQGKYLGCIKWTRALLQYCVNWAMKTGVTEINVVSVAHNRWAATHGHLDPKRGKLLYDVTAKRCGFKPSDDGYYHLDLRDTRLKYQRSH